MKKYLLNTIAAVAIFSAANAQTQFGIKGGLNMAKVTTEEGPEFESKAGVYGGLLAHIHVNNSFAIQPELVYSQQGGKFDSPLGETKLNKSYINLPVMFQYMFKNGFRLETGPQAGLLVSAETELNDVESDVKDNYNSFDFSWGFGAGYLTSSNLGFSARYNLGLSNVSEVGTNTSKNRVFQVGLFYQFGPKK